MNASMVEGAEQQKGNCVNCSLGISRPPLSDGQAVLLLRADPQPWRSSGHIVLTYDSVHLGLPRLLPDSTAPDTTRVP